MASIQQPPTISDRFTCTATTVSPEVTVVEIAGEIDMLASAPLRAYLLSTLDRTRLLVLDLDAISFLGTSGLAVLVEVRSAAQAAGVSLRLACTSRRVLRPLTIAGLVGLFDVRESRDAALPHHPIG